MNYLLDTHVVLWALYDDDKLPNKVKEIILNQNNSLYFSVVSPWEIETKHQKKPENIKINGKQVAFLCRQAGYKTINININHINEYVELGMLFNNVDHHDPFDKMLLAQAKTENMILITHDKKFKLYDDSNILLF